MSSIQKILIQLFIMAVVAQLSLAPACIPTMLFRKWVNAKPIVDIHKKWEETAGMCMCVIVVCQENKASIFLVTGCRVGSCSSAYPDLLPVCNKAGQELSCHECRGEGCNPHFLTLKDAPPTPRPEWLESVVEACNKGAAIDCQPCGWAKCVSYPGYIGSSCCPEMYKFECCSKVLLPPKPYIEPIIRRPPIPEAIETSTESETETPTISPNANATEDPNTAVTLLTTNLCIALTSLIAMTLRFANNQLQF